MKKTFFKSILCASLFVGALTSCNEVEDLYNPELARERAQEAFGLPVDPNHTWSMTSVITANITLNEDALSDYSFRIYSANPLDENSGAVILAEHPVKTDAQGKASASFKFEMPSYLTQVYVGRVDNHGRRMISISDVNNGIVSKAFGENSSASTRAIEDYELPTITVPYTEEQVNTLLANAYDLTNASKTKIEENGVFSELGGLGDNGFRDLNRTGKNVAKIDGEGVVCNYTKGFDYNGANGKYTLIIGNGATWEILDSDRQISNIDIIVANGGTLKFTGKIQITVGARLIVMKGGTVDNSTSTSEQNIYSNHSSCLIYNAGTIKTNNIYVDNGVSIQNTSSGIIYANSIKFAGGSGNTDCLINYGKIEAEEVTSNGQQGTLHNACIIRAKSINVLTLNMKQGVAIEVTDFSANQIYLRENSIIRCTNFKSNAPYFRYIKENDNTDDSVVEQERALISTEDLKEFGYNPYYNPNNVLPIGNNIYFEVNTYNNNDWTKQCYESAMSCTNTGMMKVGEAPLINITDQTDVKDPSIETATCAGKGNKPNNYVPREEPAIFTYAFEDTDKGAGDYDFNDVVIKCSAPINNEIVVTLVAVGAQKRINLMYDNPLTGQIENIFGEVHAAFENGATENFINTIKGNKPFDCPSVKIAVPAGFTYSENGDFFINVVNSSATSHLPNFTDNYEDVGVPYAILVPVDWRYPQEWQRVDSAYANFANWAENALVDMNWYTTEINESKVY